MYEYQAGLISIHDGDTLHLAVDLGCEITLEMTVRLYGLNAPELPSQAGLRARNFVTDWFSRRPWPYHVRTIKDHKEKYGRYLAVISHPGTGAELNTDLLSSGNAVPYLHAMERWVVSSNVEGHQPCDCGEHQ